MITAVDHFHSGSFQTLGALTGAEPAINTLAIISAENPNGNPLSPDMNQMRNDELVQMLQESSYTTFWKVKESLLKPIGNSLLVPNISREQALQLGRLFDQETIIFGSKTRRGGMVYELLCASNFSRKYPIGQG